MANKLIDNPQLTTGKDIIGAMWGGKRKGAGRKPKETTKTMRIPLSKVEQVKKLIGKA